MVTIEIAGRQIGAGHPTYIVAEMSANHNQDFDEAAKILKAAKDAGADCIKLQTYTADTLTIACDNEYFRLKDTLWTGRTLHDLYEEAYTPWEWQPRLKQIADDLEIDIFSTPFDATAVDFLEQLDMPAYKVASFENVDIPLMQKIARTGKPIIMSTGLASLDEVTEAVQTIRAAGNEQLALLKCTSAYPAPPEEMNLRAIPYLADTFKVPVGLSDHTLGIAVPAGAVALGACIIEKHFTLSRSIPGPDSAFSLEPHEFKAMVDSVRAVEKALGQAEYRVGDAEVKSRVFRRSLFVVQDIKAGEAFTSENVRSIRPGYGLHTRYLSNILGRSATQDVTRGTPLKREHITGELPEG